MDSEGSSDIFPPQLFSDPTLDELYHYFQAGSIAAYEHIALIKLHYKLADIVEECIERLEVGIHPTGQPSLI